MIMPTLDEMDNSIEGLLELFEEDEVEKASFASRSEAARYAASIRWKGNVKEENDPDNPVTEAGKEAMRLGAGLAGVDESSNVTPRGVRTPVFSWQMSDDVEDAKEFGTEEEARAYLAEQKSLDPEAVFLFQEGPRYWNRPEESKFPNGSWTVFPARLTMDYIFNDITPVDPSKPHSWADISWTQTNKRYAVNPETSEVDTNLVIKFGDAEGLKPEAMIMNTSPKNPAGLNREGLIRWERASMAKWTGNGEQNYCDSLGYYASIYAGFGEPYPRPSNSYRHMYKVSEGKLSDLAGNLVDSLRNAKPAQPTLWRGIGGSHQTEIKSAGKITSDAQVGDTFTIGLGATSRSIAAAQFYAKPYNIDNGKMPVLMRIRKGSKGLVLSPKMSAFPHDQEVLTGGNFTVRAKEVVNLSQKPRRIALQRMRIADVQRLPSGTRGRTALLSKEQDALKSMLEAPDKELALIIDVEQVSV